MKGWRKMRKMITNFDFIKYIIYNHTFYLINKIFLIKYLISIFKYNKFFVS